SPSRLPLRLGDGRVSDGARSPTAGACGPRCRRPGRSAVGTLTMLVSLSRIRERAQGSETGIAAPLLDPRGSGVVLGVPCASGAPAAPIVPAAHTLFGPRS